MIGKQKKGQEFHSLLNYLEGKEKAELMGGNMVGENAQELAIEFHLSQGLNLRVKRPVYHASLSLQKGEDLNNKTWNSIAEDYLIGMGFDDNQYCVYRHHDRHHSHVHITASRVKLLDGTCVSDSWDYLRSEKLLRWLEEQYGLESPLAREPGKTSPTTGERRLLQRTGDKSERVRLQNALDEALPKNATAPQLILKLRKSGIEANIVCKGEKVRGITYRLHDSKIHFSGTQLGRNYTFPNGLIKSVGMDYDFKRDREALQRANLIEVSPRAKTILATATPPDQDGESSKTPALHTQKRVDRHRQQTRKSLSPRSQPEPTSGFEL